MKTLILCLSVLILSSCSTQKFLFSKSLPMEASNEGDDNMQIFFVSGIAQTKRLKAKRYCKGMGNMKVGAIEFKESVLDGLISGATWGVIHPRTANVYCVK